MEQVIKYRAHLAAETLITSQSLLLLYNTHVFDVGWCSIIAGSHNHFIQVGTSSQAC
jgi:hypothetical protein